MKGRVGLSWKEYLLFLLWGFFLFTFFYTPGYPNPMPVTIERAVMLATVGLVAVTYTIFWYLKS